MNLVKLIPEMVSEIVQVIFSFLISFIEMQKMWQFSWMSRQLSAKSFGVSPYWHSSSSGRLEAYIVCFRESWDSVLVSFLTETVHRVLYTFILSFFQKNFYAILSTKSKGKMLLSLPPLFFWHFGYCISLSVLKAPQQ